MSTPHCNVKSTAACIALIAGQGKMALLALEEMKRAGYRVLLFAFKGLTPQEVISKADIVVYLSLTQLGRAIRSCKKYKVNSLMMAGRIPHECVYSLSWWRIDWTTLQIWLRLPDKRADTILGAIALAFKTRGIEVIDSTLFLSGQVVEEGVLTTKQPTPAILKEIIFGVKVAKGIGSLDIGQTVVVKNGVVVAVEALEGTDKCIERAAELAGAGCVVVKMAKPSQDMRFDVPVIGLKTIEKLAIAKVRALAIQAGKTLILDPEVLSLANTLGLTITAIDPDKI